ncbi:hypothetical protein KQH82_02885 [bacterium]|nr:hypothetical protein [bacterium]
MKKSAVVILVLLIAVGSSHGFDGQRKGFVLGGGLGFSPATHYEADVSVLSFGVGTVEETKVGLALNIVIGGAFDEKNVLVYEANVVGAQADFGDQSIGQGFSGATWYHYFGPVGRSVFTAVGLGFYTFKFEDFDSNDPGGGLLLGGGYEFAKHWQIGVYATFGSSSLSDDEFVDADFDHANISIMISGIAY